MTAFAPCYILFRPREDAAKPFDVLAPKVLIQPHRTALDPYVSQLKLSGRKGDLYLVDLSSRMILVRREVA